MMFDLNATKSRRWGQRQRTMHGNPRASKQPPTINVEVEASEGTQPTNQPRRTEALGRHHPKASPVIDTLVFTAVQFAIGGRCTSHHVSHHTHVTLPARSTPSRLIFIFYVGWIRPSPRDDSVAGCSWLRPPGHKGHLGGAHSLQLRPGGLGHPQARPESLDRRRCLYGPCNSGQ